MVNLLSNSKEWIFHDITGIIPTDGEWSVKTNTTLILQNHPHLLHALQLDLRGTTSKVSGTVEIC